MATAAKKKSAPAAGNKRTGTAVEKLRGGAVGAADDLLKMMEQDAGKGVSTAAEDNIVPLLYVLQKGSPQVDRSDAAFIKGAKAGDFWVRGTTTIIDGEDEGIEFVPCHFSKGWIQWGANRGGFKGRHPTRPKEAKQVPDAKNPEKLVWRMPNDRGEYNDTCDSVAESREYAGIITSLDAPISLVIPFSSTGHTPAKEWMGLINAKVMGNGKTFPIYSHVYKLTTVAKKNDLGSWHQIKVTDAGGDEEGSEAMLIADMDLYKAAKKIHTDFTSGALMADTAAPEEAGGTDDDDSDM